MSYAGDEQPTSEEISEMQAVYYSVLADNVDVSDSIALNCASLVKLFLKFTSCHCGALTNVIFASTLALLV